MPKVEMDIDTTLPPERVLGALLDFSERRPEIWPGIEPSLYEVYSVGATEADIKEGSKMPGGRVECLSAGDLFCPVRLYGIAIDSLPDRLHDEEGHEKREADHNLV